MKKVLITATVQSHIAQFHKPLINMLQAYGYDVHIAARNNLDEKNGLSLDEPNKVFDISFNRNPFSIQNVEAYKQLKKILHNNKYDIVHCNTPVGGVLSRLIANKYRRNGLKTFYTAHGFHFYKGAPKRNWLLYYPIENFFSNMTDKIITINKEDYKISKKYFKTQVFYLPGTGVNAERYHPVSDTDKNSMKKKKGYKKEDYLILCTGELNENKNQKTVIKALKKTLGIHSNVKLMLAGNGHLEQKLKNLVFDLELEKNVDFIGYRTDLEDYVSMSDLVVSASKREGLGLNIVEAMLSKKNIIASYNRGHKELIENGVTGSLVPYNDSDAFSKEIIKYIESPNIANKIKENAFLYAKQFTTKNVSKELKKIYNIEDK